MPVLVESFEEFCARHGGANTSVQIDKHKNVQLFADGAYWQQGINQPKTYDPPPDAYSRLKLQRRYHQLKAEMFEKAFTELKAQLSFNYLAPIPGMMRAVAHSGFQWIERNLGPEPSNGDDPVFGRQALLYLRDQAANHRTALVQIDQQIDALPEVRAQKEAEQRQRELNERINNHRREQARRDFETINAIELEETPNP